MRQRGSLGIAEKRDDWEQSSQSSRPVFIPRISNAGIPEYWLVDYLGLAATRYIGVGKPPTTTVCQLIEGEYQLMQFRGDDQIQARAFPELNLTAEQVFIKSAAWH